MYDRFTVRAQCILQSAMHEAHRLNHTHIDTEHLLLALLGADSGVAISILRNLGHDPAKIVLEVDCIAPWGSGICAVNHPFTANAHAAVERAIDQAHELRQDFADTEHLLLGLLGEENGIAAKVLKRFNLTRDAVLKETERLSGNRSSTESGMAAKVNCSSLSRANREFLLAIYRSAVKYYQPKIEKSTGIPLGEIAVWDHDSLHQHVMEAYWRESRPSPLRWIKSLQFRREFRQTSRRSEIDSARRSRKYTACYYRRAIYVWFDSGSMHEEGVASAVIHELSHALWERIEGQSLDSLRKGIDPKYAQKCWEFVEGFASYAELRYFVDLYPAAVRDHVRHSDPPPDSVYSRGFRRVQNAVRECGEQIFLEIPKCWPSL